MAIERPAISAGRVAGTTEVSIAVLLIKQL